MILKIMSYFYQKFCCGGRLIFGPDVASLFLSMLLIAGPAVLFCYQIIRKIYQDHKIRNGEATGIDDHSKILGYPVFVVTIVVTLVVSNGCLNNWICYIVVSHLSIVRSQRI